MSLLSDNINRDYEKLQTLNNQVKTSTFNDSTQQVIITLDENYSSSLLKMKLYTTSYLITLLSSEEFDKAFLSEIRNKLYDKTIKSAINRISGKYFKSLENQEYQKYESLFKIMNDIKKENELEQFINTLPIKFHNNVNFLLQHKSTLKYYLQMSIETALQLFEKFSIDNFPDHIKNDKQRIMYDIKNGELKYNQIRELSRKDKDVAKAILMKISKQNDIIQLLDSHSYDLDLVLLAVTRTRDIIRFLPNQVKTRQIVKAAIEHSPESIEYLSDEYLCDREILLIALKSNPFL